ncbi:type IX secretion system sortase PorU [Aureispira sp. CCB-E]|uniref:type IX secretion system sortase PorU n=2 Tax=unclassified Aureispira TaxID=2649989 RepID=UPI0028696EF8|nr:type IX secretion system sortase PorU [Aureispira sp. CCB-E]WMX15421.1 type IX secretion system sortase PorU [Aureispira sp. CCB-E]
MLNSFFKASLLTLLVSTSSYAQTTTESITINWQEQPRTYQLPDGNTLHYLYFEKANYNGTDARLPIFSKQIRLNSYGDLTARLVNEQYSPLTNTSELDLSDIDAINIETAVSFDRKKPVGVVYFTPIRKNPTTGQYEKLVHADLQVSLTPKTAPSSLSNSRNFTNTSKLSDGLIYKIAVTSTGIQKLDYDFLKSLGVDVDNIDPRKIQILGNGGNKLQERMDLPIADDLIENRIFVAGEADGSFDQNDYILFYGLGTKNWSYNSNLTCGNFKHSTNPYTDESYYFIKISSANGLRISNRTSIANTAYTTNSYDALAHHELDEINLMEQEFALPPSGREWYGESFRTLNNRTRNFNFQFSNRIESEPVTIQSDLAVRVFTPGTATLKANGNLIGNPINTPSTTVYIYSDYARRLTFPCSANILSGQNVNLEISLAHNSTAAEMWLNYLSLQARCQLRFTNGQMPFRDSRSLSQGNATYQLSNANNVTIWDVTDPSNVFIQEYAGSGNISFGADANVLREFVAFDNNQFYVPIDRGTVANQNLHGITTPPDAVFVVHSSLRAEADRLAAHRRNHDNITVDVINVEDIYNEFASGAPDVTAIRDFCRMLYLRSTPSYEFTHLLLFGIGSFDYKSLGDSRTPSNNPNLIPVYETQESLHPIRTYTSDDYFALLDDNERMTNFGLLDIAVGRLPAANIAEARTLVNKIINYETNPDAFKDWKNRLCFVADDEDGNAYFRDAQYTAQISEAQNNNYNIEKVYLDAFQQVSTAGGERYPDAQNALLDILFKGAFIVNYFGHGGDDGWSQERVFTSSNINALTNVDKLPLFITATCSFSPHDNPTTVSAGELLLLNPNGGAISLFTTVRVVVADDNATLVQHTFDVIFDKKPNGEMPTTGEVLQFSKNNAAIPSPVNSRKYALLGDPTMKLAYPHHDVRTIQINNQAITNQDTIHALELVTISGEIVDNNGNKVSNFNGTIYPTVFDKQDQLRTLGNDNDSHPANFFLRKKIIFKGQASVVNGNFSFSFMVPKDINYSLGYGKISYYAENQSNLDAHGNYDGIVVGGSNPNPPVDNQGPEVLVYMNTEEFARGGITDNNPKLLVKLYDENGINTVGNSIGHDLTGKITTPKQDEELEYVLNDFYESTKDDYTRGTIVYPLKDLEPGLHTVKIKAWDVFNNPGEGSTEFVVAESADMALAHVLNYPNPFTTSTNFQFEHNLPYQALEVQVQIYTVSGKLIKTIDRDISAEGNNGYRVDDIHWDGLDDYGDRIGKGVYIYKILVQADGATDQVKQSSEFQKLVILK